MKRSVIIWIIYAVVVLAVFFMTSCSSARPKYVARTEVVKVPEPPKKEKTIVGLHLWCLIMTGFIFHVINEDSN